MSVYSRLPTRLTYLNCGCVLTVGIAYLKTPFPMVHLIIYLLQLPLHTFFFPRNSSLAKLEEKEHLRIRTLASAVFFHK